MIRQERTFSSNYATLRRIRDALNVTQSIHTNPFTMPRLLFLLAIASMLLYTCGKDDDQGEIDRNLILNYLAQNNLEAEEDDSGVFYIINQAGDARRPSGDEPVTVTYAGVYLVDGDTLDRALSFPVTVPLSRFIDGFQEGLPYIGRGGNITLFIPSGLAFGGSPPGNIRSNAVTIYNITLQEDQKDVDRQLLVNYIEENELQVQEDVDSGIFYTITTEGDGNNPSPDDRVTVEYRGTLLDGTEFDATEPGQPTSFLLSGLIEGWQIAIPLLSKGGEGIFYIPSQLCYGSFPPGSDIPPNAILRFEIKLVNF